MGRTKKPFIDKKKSVTYRLVFKSSEYGEAGGERTFVPVRGGGRGFPELEEEHPRAPMPASMAFSHFFGGQEPTEDERKEIVSLGLPDDGYNYLQHVRVIGQGSCSLLENEGGTVVDAKPVEDRIQMSSAGGMVSSAFNPPPEDKKIIYAKELTVREEVQDEDAAEDHNPATSAFSREVEGVRGRVAKEINELQEAIIDLGEEVEEGIDTVGVGDLLDDFVVLAAQADDAATTFMGDTRARENPQNIALPEDVLDEDGDNDVIEIDYMSKYSRTLGSRGLGNQSLFSEKWAGTSASDLEGRRKRNDQLTLLDEKFENMLLEYDDDELGDLEEIAEEIQGETDLQDFAPEIEVFVDEVEEKGFRALIRESETNVLVGKDDDIIKITKELENAVLKGRRRIGREEWEDVLICVRSESNRLDCETVLSYRSKASSYQPSRISVDRAPKKTNPPAKVTVSGQVTLSSRTGLPVEVSRKSVGTCEPIVEHPLEGSGDASVNSFLERRKGETPEERKARKAAVKESQRAAKARKKELKMMYRKENIKQQKQMAGIATKTASTVVL